MKLGSKDLEHMEIRNQSKLSANARTAGVGVLKTIIILIILLFVLSISITIGIIRGIINNAPDLNLLQVQPQGYASRIYDIDGNLMQELVMEGTNREEVRYDQLPQDLIDAIISIEDSRFLYHNGIDIRGIFRAAYVALTTGRFSEGGSTITQQLIKNNLLNGGYETTLADKFERKIQEQYLALKLEETVGDKKIILQDYLNTINFGSNCLGVQTASRRYFEKPVWELTLSECTVLAAITSNPSRYNPINHPENNAKRRSIVLSNMLEQGYITQEEMDEALADDVYSRILNVSTTSSDSNTKGNVYSYFTDSVYLAVSNDLQETYHYTASQANNLLYSGGLEIITTMDPSIQAIVDEELNNPENYYNSSGELFSEFSLVYGLTIRKSDGTTVTYNEQSVTDYHKNVLDKPTFRNIFQNEADMNQAINEFKVAILEPGDTVESESVNTLLQPQASFVVMDPYTGHVLAIAGGRGEKTGSLTLNRATDSARQPGSCFKILADFAPAIDTAGATLATTFYDSPYTVNGQQIMNWWGTQYLGYNNIRQGIKYSMNVVAVKCLQNLVSPSAGFDYVKNFGITTLVDSDKVPSIALGGITYGVYNLELTAAYSAIANDGVYNAPVFYTKVLDRSGRIILENQPENTRIIKSSTAALLTEAMKDTISSDGIYSSYGIEPTGAPCQVEGMTVAGKSGSTTDSNDVWFIGYSPYYVCSIWSGYDSSKALGTSQSYHKAIWQKIMTRIHEGKQDKAFLFSDSLEYCTICSKSGLLAIDGVCNSEGSNAVTYEEAFAVGTAPTEYCNLHYTMRICQDSGQSVSNYCPEDRIIQRVFFRIDSNDLDSSVTTLDTAFLAPSALQSCTVHTAPPETEPEPETETESESQQKSQPELQESQPDTIQPSAEQPSSSLPTEESLPESSVLSWPDLPDFFPDIFEEFLPDSEKE